MKLRSLITLALLAAALPSARAGATSHVDAKIAHQQQKIHMVNERLMVERGNLHGAATKVGTVAQQLAQTNRTISAVNGRLAGLAAQATSTQRKLSWTRVQLDSARRTLQRHNDALKRRLVDAYEHNDLGYLDVLLESRSFADFIERWNDVRYIIKANEATIRERRTAATQVAGIETSLLAMQALLDQQQQAANRDHAALAVLAQERGNLSSRRARRTATRTDRSRAVRRDERRGRGGPRDADPRKTSRRRSSPRS